jgi:hypothetical protein
VGSYELPADHWGKPFPLDPGPYEARVETPQHDTVKSSFTVAAGEQRDVTLDLVVAAPPPPPLPPPVAVVPPKKGMSPLRIGGIAAAGVGVVGFGMFAGAGIASTSTYSDLKTKCGGTSGGCKGLNVTDDVNKGKLQQTLANAGLIVGAVGIAAGATLIGLSLRKPKDAGPPTAELVVGPTWAGVEGSF